MRYNIYENGGAVEGLVTLSGMTITGYITLRGDPFERMEAASKQYVDFLASTTRSSNIVSGTFNKAQLPAFTGGQVTSVASNNVLAITPTGVAPNTYTKITVGVNGLVTSGSNLTPADIPNLGWLKIATGKPTTLAGYSITDSVSRVNGVITGNLTLSGAPIAATDVATKQYTDSKVLNNKTYAVGDLITGGYDTPPTGFLRCNGGVVSKTMYSDLYSVVGDRFNIRVTPSDGKPWHISSSHQQSVPFTAYSWTDLGQIIPEGGAINTTFTFVTKNRIFVGGGHTSYFANKVRSAPINADGTIGAWVQAPDLPYRLTHSQAIVHKNRVYLIGGQEHPEPFATGYNSNTVFSAPIHSDGNIGTWVIEPPLPFTGACSTYIVNDQFVVTNKRNLCYSKFNTDSRLSSWVNVPEQGFSKLYNQHGIGTSGRAKLVCVKNKLYYIATYHPPGTVVDCYVADLDPNGVPGDFVNLNSSLGVPSGYLSWGELCVVDNVIYHFGGTEAPYPEPGWFTNKNIRASVIQEDGSLGPWGIVGTLPEMFYANSMCMVNSKIYFISHSRIWRSNFTGGLNDYSPYYDGTIQPIDIDTTPTTFRLPNYTSTTDPIGKVFVKF